MQVKSIVERVVAGKKLSIETGELAKQADAAVLVRCEDTAVLVTAVAAPDTRHVPFLPLTVEYREKQYAAGQFPGGIIKREGRPTTKEILTCRMVDRPIRPLFPKAYHEDIQVVAWVLATDDENDPDVLALIGASAALTISDIPFDGPISLCRVGLVSDEFVINPTYKQRDGGELDIVVCSSEDAVIMLEGRAASIPEEDLLTALQCGHDANRAVVEMINELDEKCGRPDRDWEPLVREEKIQELVRSPYFEKVKEALAISSKSERKSAVSELRDEATEELCDPENEEAITRQEVHAAFSEMEGLHMRQMIVEEQRRSDGRKLDEIREITCRVGLLPRLHGSALFTRGETQTLAVATLGTVQDRQRILDPLVEENPKRFMLHYNFPPFSVGEVRPMRGPGRREIGHGMLAERAFVNILPSEEDFPYTIRLVSETLESNGSSSMASVCGGTLALMDAGVPIRNPVAGIALGLVKTDEESYILTDIAGAEDHHGDMDLKIAGTQHGITSIQMDLKVKGIGMDVLRRAFNQARDARLEILRQMLTTLDRPRDQISPYAPRLIRVHIDPDSIGKLIGPGGKTIKALEADYDCNIEVEDDGTVTVSGADAERAEQAAHYIEQLGQAVQVGAIYDGTITGLKDFGAIVELFPGSDGLCHISQLADHYVREVREVCKIGDKIKVKVLSVEGNSVRLSHKAALADQKDS